MGLVVSLALLPGAQDAFALDARGKSLLALRDESSPTATTLAGSGRARGWLLAQAEKIDIIKTRDGRVHTGRVLNETQRGYLFRPAGGGPSYIVGFDQIDDMQVGTAGAPNPARPPPPPPAGDPPMPLLVAPPPLQPGPPSAAAASRVLELELIGLKETSTSIGGPIGMLCVGLGVTPLTFLFAAGAFGSTSFTIAMTIFGAIVAVVATVLGTVNLIRAISARSRRNSRINEIEEELLRLRQSYAPPEGPSLATLGGPRPTLLLAQF